MSLDLTPEERSELAQQVAAELDTGQYGDKYVLSRRQLLTLATATGGGGVLAALGADGAAAQASDDTSTGTVRGNSGGGMDVYLDQLRDPTGDEVLNIDDTGAIDATLREWVFAAARAQSLGIENTGVSLGEDNGDLVVKDSGGSVVLRYDSDSGSWVMDSLSTNQSTITEEGGLSVFADTRGTQPSQYHWDLVASFEGYDFEQNGNLTISPSDFTQYIDDGNRIRLVIYDFEDNDSSSDNPLELQIDDTQSGIATVDYLTVDTALNTRRVSSSDWIELFTPTATQSADRHAGVFDMILMRGERFIWTGNGAAGFSQQGESMFRVFGGNQRLQGETSFEFRHQGTSAVLNMAVLAQDRFFSLTG